MKYRRNHILRQPRPAGAPVRRRWLLSLMGLWLALEVWTQSVEDDAHWTPKYERMDLAPILASKELQAEDYETLLVQTGLGRPTVDLLFDEGRESEILAYQSDFFEDVEVRCQRSNVIVSGERLMSTEDLSEAVGPKLAPVLPGDILITPCSHVFGWRNGHAAIVVKAPGSDGTGGWTLESVSLGVTSKLRRLNRWRNYPAFVILRLNEAAGRREAAVAEEEYVGVPYRLTAGLWDEAVEGTQCAHLVWSCYRRVGVDLDSDGGWLVTPRDLLKSPLLEVIQIYGMNPENFKN